VDPEDKWDLFEKCQLEEMGGWPDGLEPITHSTTSNNDGRVNNNDDSDEEVKRRVLWTDEDDLHMLKGLQNGHSYDTIAETSRFTSTQVENRYYNTKHTGVQEYRNPLMTKRWTDEDDLHMLKGLQNANFY